MAERMVRAHRLEQGQHQQVPNQYFRLHQERTAARDVPLCIPRLRLAWVAFGVGLGLVLISLCLMIGGAASSSTVYGGRASTNLTPVYVGIALLIIGLVCLVVFGVQFARVRNVQKDEHIRQVDTGHDNVAFPASRQPDLLPMTNIYPKETADHTYTQSGLSDSPKDSAYSSITMGSVAGSELNAQRLSDANSQSLLVSNRPMDDRLRFTKPNGPSTGPSIQGNPAYRNARYPAPHGPNPAVPYDTRRPHHSLPQRPFSQRHDGTLLHGDHSSQATVSTHGPTMSSRSAVVTVERHGQPSSSSSGRQVVSGVSPGQVTANPMISNDPMSIQPIKNRNENRSRPMPTQSSSLVI